jgi:S1-C subfamily serine protease
MRKLFVLWFSITLPLSAVPMRPVTPRGELSVQEKATISLFKRSIPSVVYITTLVAVQDYFTLNITQIPQGTGSGFVWDDEGHIVTNFHVAQSIASGQAEAQVTLSDRSKWPATLVGVAPDKDIAVLKIKAPRARLAPMAIGTSADLQVGQSVFAIGNPFGLDQSLTTGVISALGREIQSLTGRPIQGVIQTDASINPGNSGGPLLDSAGRLIGVNTAIYSPSGASAGVGFAVPIDVVARIVPQLITHGRVIRPALGVTLVDDAITQNLGLKGVLIMDIVPHSAASGAGLQPTRRDRRSGDILLGDIIVGLSGEKIDDVNDLYNALEKRRIGERVILDILRDDQRRQVSITLEPSRE